MGLLKEFYGRGPERGKTYLHDDLVVVLLRGGFSRAEETLFAAGRGDAVMEQRAAFNDAMRGKFNALIERETGREVAAMVSGNHQQPDVHALMFVLTQNELVEPQ